MHIEDLREFALGLGDVEECLPFGPDTLVFKVDNKIFLLVALDAHPLTLNVKCDPGKAIELRETYACIQPGYHMNKKHWNTIEVEGTLDRDSLCGFIHDSFNLVRRKPSRTRKTDH